jgi:hypothetical protein
MAHVQHAQAAIHLLSQASALAADLKQQPWDFAVEIGCLLAAGLTHSELRWLLGKGLVEHAHETTLLGEERRTFAPLGKTTLTPATCFVLTPAGDEYLQALAGEDPVPEAAPADGTPAGPCVPTWDRDRQELRLGGLLVKQFKVPAPNQEVVLAAFQEEHWPARIDDPLPGAPSADPKRRLHETITSLNRNQRRRLIQFMGDGSGQGVRWERIALVGNGNGEP